MHSLKDEVRELHSGDSNDGDALDVAMACETRALFSVRAPLLLTLYAAVATLVAGTGLLVKAHRELLGPASLTALLCVAAALCYAFALRAHLAGRERSLGEDYVLLLGALLASSAVGYAESQFAWLDAGWSRHLLMLAAWHALTAYALDSRLVLAVSLTSFAAWLGVEPTLGGLLEPRLPWLAAGWRALGCAGLFAIGAAAHARVARLPTFRDVYELFAANLALAGALAVGFTGQLWTGAVLLVTLALGTARYGLWRDRESLVLAAVGYGTLGAVALEARLVKDFMLASNLGLATVLAAVVVMLKLRARLKAARQ